MAGVLSLQAHIYFTGPQIRPDDISCAAPDGCGRIAAFDGSESDDGA